jgi:hypothetical protein
MSIGRLAKIYVDVSDLGSGGIFWGDLPGLEPSLPRQDSLGDWFLDLRTPDRVNPVVLQQVPEKHVLKNRVHLDVNVEDLRTAISDVQDAGGTLLREIRSGFAVIADPDGNEFCLIPPA